MTNDSSSFSTFLLGIVLGKFARIEAEHRVGILTQACGRHTFVSEIVRLEATPMSTYVTATTFRETIRRRAKRISCECLGTAFKFTVT